MYASDFGIHGSVEYYLGLDLWKLNVGYCLDPLCPPPHLTQSYWVISGSHFYPGGSVRSLPQSIEGYQWLWKEEATLQGDVIPMQTVVQENAERCFANIFKRTRGFQ